MRKQSITFLEQLLSAPSPSGYEQPAQRLFRDYITPYCQVSSDVLGNVYGFIPGQGKDRPKVMLVGHSDEIGLQIKYIDDKIRGFCILPPSAGLMPI